MCWSQICISVCHTRSDMDTAPEWCVHALLVMASVLKTLFMLLDLKIFTCHNLNSEQNNKHKNVKM